MLGARAAASPRHDHSKVLINKRVLLALPNASAPPPVTFPEAEILEEYEESSLAIVDSDSVLLVKARGADAGVEIIVRDEYDKIFVNGLVIDTRLGTSATLSERDRDPAYARDESGTWIVQFIGPIKRTWMERLRADGLTLVQYLPYNAFIAAGTFRAIDAIAQQEFVQYTEQLHTAFKPTVQVHAETSVPLWVQVATTSETPQAVANLEVLSEKGIEANAWSATETRVEGTFRGRDVAAILREPLVIAVTHRPTIALSDERTAISLTSFAPGTHPQQYKQWLAEICPSCTNLSGDSYYVGVADSGLDGGSHTAASQIQNEPNASGAHRQDLPASRIIYGTNFSPATGTWNPQDGEVPDSTGTLHDVIGHGTLVAGMVAGDPGAGTTDSGGFLWGLGVAPSAGLLITKINTYNVTARAVEDVARDARTRASPAYIQNHSYNQYQTNRNDPNFSDCTKYLDGYYSTLLAGLRCCHARRRSRHAPRSADPVHRLCRQCQPAAHQSRLWQRRFSGFAPGHGEERAGSR